MVSGTLDSTREGEGATERKLPLYEAGFHPSLVLSCLLSALSCRLSHPEAHVSCLQHSCLQQRWLWGCGFLGGCSCSAIEEAFHVCSLCCCSQPAPHPGPAAQAVGGAAARDRGPAQHRREAGAQRQLVRADKPQPLGFLSGNILHLSWIYFLPIIKPRCRKGTEKWFVPFVLSCRMRGCSLLLSASLSFSG